MSTVIRPEVSLNNPYWIDKHRYYELKHFCLQYPVWQQRLKDLIKPNSPNLSDIPIISVSDPTARIAEARLYFKDRIEMVEMAGKATDEWIAEYLVKAVTENLSYEKLRALTGIPCCKDIYYTEYRKFFWLLSNARK